MIYVVDTDVPEAVYAIGGTEIATSEVGQLVHDLFAAFFYEYPDYADENFKERVEKLGIDLGDVLFWEEHWKSRGSK